MPPDPDEICGRVGGRGTKTKKAVFRRQQKRQESRSSAVHTPMEKQNSKEKMNIADNLIY